MQQTGHLECEWYISFYCRFASYYDFKVWMIGIDWEKTNVRNELGVALEQHNIMNSCTYQLVNDDNRWCRLNIRMSSYMYRNSHYKDHKDLLDFYVVDRYPRLMRDKIIAHSAPNYLPLSPMKEYFKNIVTLAFRRLSHHRHPNKKVMCICTNCCVDATVVVQNDACHP